MISSLAFVVVSTTCSLVGSIGSRAGCPCGTVVTVSHIKLVKSKKGEGIYERSYHMGI